MSTKDRQSAVPTTLPFTDQQIYEAAERRALADGYHRFMVTSAETRVVTKARWAGDTPGSFLIAVRVVPLRDPDDAKTVMRGMMVFDDLELPFKNPDFPNHSVPDTWRNVAARICAYFDIVPEPIKDKESGAWIYNGKQLAEGKVEAARKAAQKAIGQKLQEVWRNPKELLNCAMYAEVYSKKNYNKLRNCTGTRDPDREVTIPVKQAPGAGDSEGGNGAALAPASLKKR